MALLNEGMNTEAEVPDWWLGDRSVEAEVVTAAAVVSAVVVDGEPELKL